MKIEDIQKILDEYATSEKGKKMNDNMVNIRIANVLKSQDEEWLKNQKNVRKKQWKGMSAEQRKNHAQRSKDGLRNAVANPIQTPYGVFQTQSEFKEKTGWNYGDKCKMLPHLYYKIEDGPGEAPYENVWYSPWMTVGTRGRAKMYAKASELNFENFNNMKDKFSWWQKVCRLHPEDFYVINEPKREWNLEP